MNVLFICTANSCRSILSEALFNHLAPPGVRAVSAGSFPSGQLNPMALETLRAVGIATDGLASKGLDAFAAAPPDIVISVCDKAAGEPCPVYFGAAIKAHWGLADPSEVIGDPATRRAAFEATLDKIRQRCTALLQLPLGELSAEALKHELDRLGAV
jgi:arsenate reductase